ncbi:MAG: twin-arginine translocase TatA/TatE family subunit [Janthinobacterium lividum]
MLPLAFGFGSPVEIGMIVGVVVLLFGGSKLAGFGKSLGEGIKEFKKATTDDDKVVSVSTPVVTQNTAPVVTQEPPVIAGAKTEEK